MENNYQDRIYIVGRMMFVVLLFLVITSYSNNSERHNPVKARTEFVSQLCFSHANATVVDLTRIPAFESCWISFVDRMSFRLSDENLKISTDNHRITQILIQLHKTHLFITPFNYRDLYYLLFPKDSGELPVLG